MNFTLTSSDDELFFHTVGANDVVFLPWSISRVQQSDLGQGNGYHILVLPLRTICVFLLSDCLLLDVVLSLSLARVSGTLFLSTSLQHLLRKRLKLHLFSLSSPILALSTKLTFSLCVVLVVAFCYL